MPFCTRTPMGSPPPTRAELRTRTEEFVRSVLPDIDPLAFENLVATIVDEFEWVVDFDHVV